jgi:hypothetical protein
MERDVDAQNFVFCFEKQTMVGVLEGREWNTLEYQTQFDSKK